LKFLAHSIEFFMKNAITITAIIKNRLILRLPPSNDNLNLSNITEPKPLSPSSEL